MNKSDTIIPDHTIRAFEKNQYAQYNNNILKVQKYNKTV